MKLKLMWAIPMTLVALAACLFIAGNIDVFSWSEAGRFGLVSVGVGVFVLTATCPLFEDF